MADPFNPSSRSGDYNRMSPFWRMIDAILGGAPSLRLLADVYLPKFPNESQADYDFRKANAPLTNIYADISRNLASKPFSKQVDINADAPEVLAGKMNDQTKRRAGGLVDDIDGQGNSLHVFASDVFKAGLDKGIAWVLVDYTPARRRTDGRALSRAEEREQGLRPYWVHVPCERVLAVYSEFVNGIEVLVHARLDEPTVARDGFTEVVKNRVRVIDRPVTANAPDGRPIAFGPAVWTLYEEKTSTGGNVAWEVIDEGDYSIGVIPLVPFIAGKRHGTSYVIDPPLRDLAWMQIEEFQQESNLKEVKSLTAFNMLVGEGITPPTSQDEDGNAIPIRVPVGPRAVLFAPPSTNVTGTASNGTWKFIGPEASSLSFLKEDLAAFRQEMRDLGMQPLHPANLTVITSANISQKASSAVQAWAILFKDTLDRCLALTSQWLGIDDTTVATVHTDFAVEVNSEGDIGELLKARAAGEISRLTYWSEMQRRGKLGPEFDPETEQDRLDDEPPALGDIPPAPRNDDGIAA